MSGIGFAVPANTVKTVVRQLIEKGSVQHAYVGVTLQEIDPSLAKGLGLDVQSGLLVQTVQPGSPAERAGLQGGTGQTVVDGISVGKGGDLIVSIDGAPVAVMGDLRTELDKHAPGDKVRLGIIRDGARRTVTVTLGSQPSAAS